MFATAAHARAAFITPAEDAWPSSLDDLGVHRPIGLWVRGQVGAVAAPTPAVAVVGARAATGYGENVAMELSAELVRRGARIISGAAFGIDGMAHRAALACGGTTIAFLAGGVDRAYPASHSGLLDGIAVDGAVVSEVAPGGAPTKWRFLQRNRLIAAAADATVVVEAGWRSGSLNTAGHAAALGRPLGAVPGPITSAASAGCHRLLREADARCVTSAEEVWEMLGFSDSPMLWSDTEMSRSTDDATRVLDALSARAWRDSFDIAQRSGLGVTEVEAVLGILSVEARAERGSAGWRAVSASRSGGGAA